MLVPSHIMVGHQCILPATCASTCSAIISVIQRGRQAQGVDKAKITWSKVVEPGLEPRQSGSRAVTLNSFSPLSFSPLGSSTP